MDTNEFKVRMRQHKLKIASGLAALILGLVGMFSQCNTPTPQARKCFHQCSDTAIDCVTWLKHKTPEARAQCLSSLQRCIIECEHRTLNPPDGGTTDGYTRMEDRQRRVQQDLP